LPCGERQGYGEVNILRTGAEHRRWCASRL
jgi:hypothetical protein